MRWFSVLALPGVLVFGLAAQAPAAQVPAAARQPGLYATIATGEGSVVLKLFEQETPVTVRNFVDLALGRKSWRDPKTGRMARRPFYNGLTFHRVIPDFMIQGGDPLGNGLGATQPIRDEFRSDLKFDVPGRLAMANAGSRFTGSCQFFITEVPTPHLNGRHTIFGQVVEGMDVVKKIARVPADSEGMARNPVKIVSITFKREGPAPADDVLAPPAAKKAAPARRARPARKK